MNHLPNPVGPAASSKTERATDEQSAVKCRTASNDIRSNAPERGTNNQTNEERAGGETRVVTRDSELVGQRRQSQGNALQPEAKSNQYTCTETINESTYLSAIQPNPQSTNRPH